MRRTYENISKGWGRQRSGQPFAEATGCRILEAQRISKFKSPFCRECGRIGRKWH